MSDTETTAEDPRVASARGLLAGSKAATNRSASGIRAAAWWERLETSLEELLAFIDERASRDAALKAAWRKSSDDLARTVAEVKAERGES